MTSTFPSAPPSNKLDPIALPPSYDEAVRNVGPEQIHVDTSELQHSVQASPQDQLLDKINQEEEEAKKKQQQYNAGAPIVTQPQTTYNFPPPNTQPVYVQTTQPLPSNDCCIFCYTCNGEDIADVVYCLFCCSRHASGHDAGCCHCGEHCCDCGECDCDCGDCDCNCGDCDCDCGDCNCDGGDCDCDCGDCTIL